MIINIAMDGSLMEEAQIAKVKDTILAEFAAARAELNQRIQSQGNILSWTIGLMGSFIGALISLKPKGESTLIFELLNNPTPEIGGLFSALCAGFVIGNELLLTFWLYQLYLMIHLDSYIKDLGDKLTEVIGVDATLSLLVWGGRPRDPLSPLSSKTKKVVFKLLFRICDALQPIAIYAITFIGLLLLTLINLKLAFKDQAFSSYIQKGLVVESSLLLAGYLSLIAVHGLLHLYKDIFVAKKFHGLHISNQAIGDVDYKITDQGSKAEIPAFFENKDKDEIAGEPI